MVVSTPGVLWRWSMSYGVIGPVRGVRLAVKRRVGDPLVAPVAILREDRGGSCDREIEETLGGAPAGVDVHSSTAIRC